MSLILEALRKSEAERRRGQVPGLHAEPTPAPRPTRHALRPGWWPLLVLLAVAAMAVALWLAFRPATPPGAGDTAAQSSIALPAADSSGSDAAASPQAAGETAVAGVAARPSAASDDTRVPPAGSRALRSTAPDVPRAAESVTDAVAPSRSAAVVGTRPGAEAASPARGDSVATLPVATPAPTAEPAAAPLPPTPTPAPATPARAALRLSDLDSAQRQQLPPLRMSMHMWAPTQRFAIIDGHRVSEGDRVGEAVVAEITATGVVLDWQGLRLQIPVP